MQVKRFWDSDQHVARVRGVDDGLPVNARSGNAAPVFTDRAKLGIPQKVRSAESGVITPGVIERVVRVRAWRNIQARVVDDLALDERFDVGRFAGFPKPLRALVERERRGDVADPTAARFIRPHRSADSRLKVRLDRLRRCAEFLVHLHDWQAGDLRKLPARDSASRGGAAIDLRVRNNALVEPHIRDFFALVANERDDVPQIARLRSEGQRRCRKLTRHQCLPVEEFLRLNRAASSEGASLQANIEFRSLASQEGAERRDSDETEDRSGNAGGRDCANDEGESGCCGTGHLDHPPAVRTVPQRRRTNSGSPMMYPSECLRENDTQTDLRLAIHATDPNHRIARL